MLKKRSKIPTKSSPRNSPFFSLPLRNILMIKGCRHGHLGSEITFRDPIRKLIHRKGGGWGGYHKMEWPIICAPNTA